MTIAPLSDADLRDLARRGAEAARTAGWRALVAEGLAVWLDEAAGCCRVLPGREAAARELFVDVVGQYLTPGA